MPLVWLIVFFSGSSGSCGSVLPIMRSAGSVVSLITGKLLSIWLTPTGSLPPACTRERRQPTQARSAAVAARGVACARTLSLAHSCSVPASRPLSVSLCLSVSLSLSLALSLSISQGHFLSSIIYLPPSLPVLRPLSPSPSGSRERRRRRRRRRQRRRRWRWRRRTICTVDGGHGLAEHTSGAFSALRILYGEAPDHEEPPTVISFGLPGWPAWSPMHTLEVDLYCRAGEIGAQQQGCWRSEEPTITGERACLAIGP